MKNVIAMAMDKCREYGLLSPYYQYSKRCGCFACPNQRITQLRHLRDNHRELFDKLVELENQDNLIGDMFNTQTKTSIRDVDKNLEYEKSSINDI